VLFVVLSLVLMTLWYREPVTGPLHRVRTVVHAVTAPVSAAGELVTRPVRGFAAWITDLGVSRSQLEELRSQNERLRTRVAELEEARLENARLRSLVKIVSAQQYESIGAGVIGRPSNQWDGVIVINRGSKDGIKTGMPVVGPRGLLGQTVNVSPGASYVRLITDQRSGVAAMIQRNRVEGIVRGSIDGRLSLDFVSNETTVRAGDVIITSGIGGVYPKGIVIGEVVSVEKEPNALYQAIRVMPAGDPSKLEEVLVFVGGTPATVPEGGE
jgi:rod shape-determining protein MreC